MIEFDERELDTELYFDEGDSPVEDSYAQYLREMGKFPVLEPNQTKQLAAQGRRPEVIQGNLRLVIHALKPYLFRRNPGVTPLELISAGNLALVEAVEDYDHTRSNTFSTFAVPRIKKALQLAVNERQALVPPADLSRQVHQTKYEEDKSIEGVSEMTIYRARMASETMISLSAPYDSNHTIDNDGAAFGEVIAIKQPSVEDQAEQNLTRAQLEELIAELPTREGQIIALRFGLNDDEDEHTLAEIGRKFGITGERARQIQVQAILLLQEKALDRPELSAVS